MEVDGKADINGPRRKTFFVIAGLEAKFSSHHAKPWVGIRERFKTRGNFEASAEYRDWVGRKSVLFKLRLGVRDLLALERLIRPGELQGNEKFIGRRVAVDVEAGLQLRFQPYFCGGAALDSYFLGRRDAKYGVTLGS